MRTTVPFPETLDDFDLREALMLLDCYIKRGALAAGDAGVRALTDELNGLASRLAPPRTPEAVANVLHGYELLDAQAAPLPATALGDAWSRFSGDERLLADAALSVAEGHSIPTTLESGAVRVQKVEVEAVRTSSFATGALSAQVHFRREQALVKEFAAFLRAAGHAIAGHRYIIPGQTIALQADLFDETSNVLYAASGSVSRDSLHVAIGELADFGRLEATAPVHAILLPRRPSDDLLRMVAACDIDAVWRDEGGFAQA